MNLADFVRRKPRVLEIVVLEDSIRIDFKDKNRCLWNMSILATEDGTQVHIAPVSLLRSEGITIQLRPSKPAEGGVMR